MAAVLALCAGAAAAQTGTIRGRVTDEATNEPIPFATVVLQDSRLGTVTDLEGAFVLEGVPDEVARMVTDALDVPTIGIGAGRHCDGQVLVFHDVLGLEDRIVPKFVRRYASLKEDAVAAVGAFASDVRSGAFPSDDESYHLNAEQAEALSLYGAEA